MNYQTTLSAIDYLDPDNLSHAEAYVAHRHADAAKLLSEMQWRPTIPGVMQCRIYEHSILWDVMGNKLHAGVTEPRYEMLRNGADDIDMAHLPQVLAFLLARNW